MGTLRIGTGHGYHFDDGALQLLRTAVVTRLTAGRSFDLYVHPPRGEWPAEKVTVTPQTPAAFYFQDMDVKTIDDDDLERLLSEIELTDALQCSSSSE